MGAHATSLRYRFDKCSSTFSHAYSNATRQVGAGTGLPTLVVFYYFLKHPNVKWNAVHISFADYNISVLEAATVPNLLLTWHFVRCSIPFPHEGDLEITKSLLSEFLKDLSGKAIYLTGLSGSWGDAFCQLIQPLKGPPCQEKTEVVFLASETIYSPASIRPFTEVLMKVLTSTRSAGGRAKALIAAKRVYFGVGGGVDEFLQILEEYHVTANPVWESPGLGVRRIILEVLDNA